MREFEAKPAKQSVETSALAEDLRLTTTHGVARSAFLTPTGVLKPEFAELLTIYGVDVGRAPSEIIAQMKENWWRESRGLRDEVVQQYFSSPPPQRLELLRQIEHVDKVDAPPLNYSHGLLMGGTLSWVRERLYNLVAQWDAGARFEKLVMLGADRPLDSSHGESEQAMLNPIVGGLRFKPDWQINSLARYEDEMDMMKIVFEQSVVPEAWGTVVPIIWIKSIGKNGRNPNTEQTVVDYLATANDEPFGFVLSASSQPFAHYQNLVTAAVYAEAGVRAQGFIATGAAGYEATPHSYREYAYLDQMIRRFEYELRYWQALEKSGDINLNKSFGESSHGRPRIP